MEYIEGKKFDSFETMNFEEKVACYQSVLDLNQMRVLHGDLEPWNFIIANNNSSRN